MGAPTLLAGDQAWVRAMDLCVRAFVDEPYVVELYGPDPGDRERGLQSMFHAAPPWPGAQIVAIEHDDVLVGSVVVCQPEHCHACARGGEPGPPEGTPERDEWQFEQNVVRAHAGLAPHGWLAKVAVDPDARGAGLGRLLVAEARRVCDGPIVLECQPHRSGFYASCGFETIGTVPDPAGPDALLMRAGG